MSEENKFENFINNLYKNRKSPSTWYILPYDFDILYLGGEFPNIPIGTFVNDYVFCIIGHGKNKKYPKHGLGVAKDPMTVLLSKKKKAWRVFLLRKYYSKYLKSYYWLRITPEISYLDYKISSIKIIKGASKALQSIGDKFEGLMKKYQKTIKTKEYDFNDLEILLNNFNPDITIKNIVKTYRYHCKIEDIIKGKK